MALCAASVAGICLAADATSSVSSANVVGYQTITLQPGWNMFSINFSSLTDPDGMTLDEIFPLKDAEGNVKEGMTLAASAGAADYVKVWDSSKQAYSQNFYALKMPVNHANNYKWVKNIGAVADIKIKSGSGFWFFLCGSNPVSFQIAGDVEYSNTGTTITINPGWNMIGAPYAGALDFNRLGIEYWQGLVDAGKVTAAASAGASDYVKLWNSETQAYDINYYLLKMPVNHANNYKWVKNIGTVAPDTIQDMGKGLWYYHMGNTSFELTLPYPYTLE